MKNLFRGIIVLVAMLFIMSNASQAQRLDLENTYEISGKAKRGYLGNVEINEPNQEVRLTFVTKNNSQKAKFEVYVFDFKFNFVRKDEEIIEFERARSKFSWFKYRGDQYMGTALHVEPNLMGTLVLRRKRKDYGWDWLYGGYTVKTTLEEKLKPKTDDGRKLFYYKHAEYPTGNALILSGEKGKLKKGEDPFRHMRNFVVQKYNIDIDVLGNLDIKFDHPQTVVFAGQFPTAGDEEEGDAPEEPDAFFLFAPSGAVSKKERDPNTGNWTYIRVSANCELKERISLKLPSGGWNMENFQVAGNNMYLMGPAENKKEPYKDLFNAGGKYDQYQVACIADGKVKYVGVNNLDDFENKKVLPEGEKKGDDYKGKKYKTTYADVLPNGHLAVTGQTLNPGQEGIDWEDIMMFQFDNQGKLVANYAVRKENNNKYSEASATQQKILFNPSTKEAYWIKLEIDGARTSGGAFGTPLKFKNFTYPSVAKLDYKNYKLSAFQSFGKNEKGKQEYYLNNRVPFLPIPGQEDKVIFFGETKNGRTLWFGRMAID